MKRSNIKFSTLLTALVMVISACSPSQQRQKVRPNGETAGITQNNDPEDLPPVVEQKVQLVDNSFQEILADEEKAKQYETPQTAIKNGEDLMYVGYTKLKNVKSIYDRTKHELEVSGVAEVMNADKKTVRVSQEFKIKGKYKASRGTINLRPAEDSQDENDLQVRAVVTCFKSDIDESYDCARAIIDLFIKHKGNYYTEQLESTAFQKPKIVGEKEQDKPQLDMDLVDPEDQGQQVKNNADAADQDQQQGNAEEPKKEEPAKPVVVITPTTPVASRPVTVVIDDSKEEADPEALAQVEEGDEESIAGRYEGKAALVKLAKLFLAPERTKPSEDKVQAGAKADEEEDEEDQAVEIPVKDSKGRLRLKNQAVGSPDSGRLRNASFLKTHIETYKLQNEIVIANSSPKNYYGTQEMMEVLEAIGDKISSIERNKLFISRISAKAGGRLPPSKSHQNGMDVDIGYFTTQGKVQFPIVASGGSLKRSDFSVSKTLAMFKFLMTQQVSPVDRLFVDQSIINSLCREAKNSGKLRGSESSAYKKLFENMQHVDGHGNHFHMRLRCTPNQPDCRHRIYKKMNNCNG